MLTISLTIDFIALAVASAVVVQRLLRYRRVRIDHVVLFCLGHAYYLSLASIMLTTRAMNHTYWFVYGYFAGVTDARRLTTSLWSLGLLLAFLGGAKLGAGGRGVPARSSDLLSRTRPSRAAPAMALTITMLGIFLLVVVRYRSVVLEGYRSLDPSRIQGQTGRGLLSAVATATILSALFMLHVTLPNMSRVIARRAITVAGIAIVVPAAVLLMAGGRMYVATCLVVIVVWFSHARAPISRMLIVAVGLGGFVALTFAGSVRTGELPDRETLGFYATEESVLTIISQGNFLSSDREVFMPVRIPKYLASDISNAIPRVILPTKDSMRLDPEDEGYSVTSALGATHLQVSSLINFGLIGSMFAFGALAYGLSRLKRFVLVHDWSIWSLTYASASGALAFSMFRDPFSISVIRWMLVNACVLPAVYAAAVTVSRRRPLKGSTPRVTIAQTPI